MAPGLYVNSPHGVDNLSVGEYTVHLTNFEKLGLMEIHKFLLFTVQTNKRAIFLE